MDEQTSQETNATAPTRREYLSPRLRVYGALSSLTRNVGMNGTVADPGGFGGMTKTS